MSNHSDFPRGALTDYLLSTLGSLVLVGDGKAPPEGGWDDDPNKPTSNYIPYVVLLPLPAQRGTGSFGDSGTEWRLGYSITGYGINRKQVEDYQQVARDAVLGLVRTDVTLSGNSWRVVQAEVNSLGGVARRDETEPSEFSEIDVVTIWMSKEL